jgi:RNA polymerase sigma-70 factor (ECF subfamily)
MELFNMMCRGREFRARLETNRRRLYRMAYAWCRDAHLADDLVQEAIVNALRNSSQLRSFEALDSWLFSILANCWKSHLRSRKESEEFDEENFHTDLDPEQITSRDQTVARVQLAIAKLPVGQRQAITLVDLEGFSYAEVAGILEIPIGTVMSRLCRARQALKDLLLGNGISADKSAHLVRVK